jgi:hypothetical protein
MTAQIHPLHAKAATRAELLRTIKIVHEESLVGKEFDAELIGEFVSALEEYFRADNRLDDYFSRRLALSEGDAAGLARLFDEDERSG